MEKFSSKNGGRNAEAQVIYQISYPIAYAYIGGAKLAHDY